MNRSESILWPHHCRPGSNVSPKVSPLDTFQNSLSLHLRFSQTLNPSIFFLRSLKSIGSWLWMEAIRKQASKFREQVAKQQQVLLSLYMCMWWNSNGLILEKYIPDLYLFQCRYVRSVLNVRNLVQFLVFMGSMYGFRAIWLNRTLGVSGFGCWFGWCDDPLCFFWVGMGWILGNWLWIYLVRMRNWDGSELMDIVDLPHRWDCGVLKNGDLMY